VRARPKERRAGKSCPWRSEHHAYCMPRDYSPKSLNRRAENVELSVNEPLTDTGPPTLRCEGPPDRLANVSASEEREPADAHTALTPNLRSGSPLLLARLPSKRCLCPIHKTPKTQCQIGNSTSTMTSRSGGPCQNSPKHSSGVYLLRHPKRLDAVAPRQFYSNSDVRHSELDTTPLYSSLWYQLQEVNVTRGAITSSLQEYDSQSVYKL